MAELKPIRAMSILKVRNLLGNAVTALEDARLTRLSVGRRFDAAYDAGFGCALALLEANKLECQGPGHHRETLMHMVSMLSLKGSTAEQIPGLVMLRNANRYDAARSITEDIVRDAITWAERVQAETEGWFQKKYPQGLKP